MGGKLVSELRARVADGDRLGRDLHWLGDGVHGAQFACKHLAARVLLDCLHTLKIDLKRLWGGLNVDKFEDDIAAQVFAGGAHVDAIEWPGRPGGASPASARTRAGWSSGRGRGRW